MGWGWGPAPDQEEERMGGGGPHDGQKSKKRRPTIITKEKLSMAKLVVADLEAQLKRVSQLSFFLLNSVVQGAGLNKKPPS